VNQLKRIKMDKGYYCLICKKLLLADEFGVIVHDDIPHPPDMSFDEDKKPQ
jgi:hypothetical protein|tara:strand:+ start:551 stop:703 length:153 start_codon:yes stop_codon:yes gene_type:complete